MSALRFHSVKKIHSRKGFGPARRVELRKRIALHQQLRAEVDRGGRGK